MRTLSHVVTFFHPDVRPNTLTIDTGIDVIDWGYHLNTQTYPTYAGEVVQILSTYIDDVTITGTVTTYTEMEQIYKWFLQYIGIATQGARNFTIDGVGTRSYNETPVIMKYHHRQWQLSIRPTELPGFRYGTEVVTPQWQLKAAVVEVDEDITNETRNLVMAQVDGDLQEIGRIHLYMKDNPFEDPGAGSTKAGRAALVHQRIDELADDYNSFLPSYTGGKPVESTYDKPGRPTASKPAKKDNVNNTQNATSTRKAAKKTGPFGTGSGTIFP